MIKMVEDMLTKKSSNNSDVVKDKGISKILEIKLMPYN